MLSFVLQLCPEHGHWSASLFVFASFPSRESGRVLFNKFLNAAVAPVCEAIKACPVHEARQWLFLSGWYPVCVCQYPPWQQLRLEFVSLEVKVDSIAWFDESMRQ